jgi:DNA-directed RNA polymerase subunit H (RpoH/RPB5)
MTIITELDAFDIDHNNLIDPHVTLPREKKEEMLEKYI